MVKFSDATHPVRCIITGPNKCGKKCFPTNLFLKNNNDFEKIYIYSPSVHQDLYQKFFICFSNYIPLNIIPNILSEEDIVSIFLE